MENKKLIPNSTQLPNIATDFIIPNLREGELKCYLYICRRTYGFHKEEDRISLSQFVKGIIDKKGKRLDHGAGASKPVIVQALANLEKANLIFIKKEVEGNSYKLNLQVNIERALRKIKEIRSENIKIKKEKPKQSRLIKVVRKPNHPQLGNLTSRGNETLPVEVRKPNTQKKGKQSETKIYIYLENEKFLEKWESFIEMRKSIKKNPTEYAKELLLKRLHNYDLSDALRLLDKSILNNWQDIYPEKDLKTIQQRQEEINVGRPKAEEDRRGTPEMIERLQTVREKLATKFSM